VRLRAALVGDEGVEAFCSINHREMLLARALPEKEEKAISILMRKGTNLN